MTDATMTHVSERTARRASLGRHVLPYAMLSPAVLVTLAIVFFPMLQTAWMSLHDYVLFRPNDFTWVGLDNFKAALSDEVFWISLKHTIIWMCTTIPAQLLLGLATALLLNQEFPWRPVARALIIIPWALPSVVIALMWVWIYDSNYGIANELLLRMGLIQQAIPWLADPDTALASIILTLTWQGFPFFAVMILAGLQSIPQSYYEAASIDGASAWRQFWHITLPGISGVMMTAVLLRMIWVANSFDVIFVMTGGGPGYSTHTLPLYAFIKARTNLDFGYGSAIAVLFTMLLMVVVLFYLRRTGKAVE
ncbi:MAG: carbohydrate ABC transporter permease [Salipiger thiooxidans]|jgi:multiple sugar transport system permease protein|uniref:carbohydrate ABC transporter permease n=2 Tax=Salipiger TaxID=263377 RepID=UPI000C584A69|nr:sugar ABC transporter permease [Salipiger thiooxidans]MAU46344.1 sugar ABC transporter permease [Salipiger sp.]MBN8187189.1 sugar ABC transporter permease [Salipiger thiooxidans]MCA0847337.1 sugar ABC transporter permease [Salipiger thiooxidans]NVK61991.1 sugar ABC transporter permease [Paracoccaceae bacterium]